MDEDSKKFTAFLTPIGLMQWTYAAFGLCNVPATFARAMRLLLDGIQNVLSYFDDALIFTYDWSTHLETLNSILSAMATHGFTTRQTKLYIGYEEIEFVGDLSFGKDKQKPEMVKIDKLIKLSTPKTMR
ncbi:reverse transcriptase [Plakobranchus ocellatus]|uniref:Reverse transcriptase n=1 Tax=Plakobranchus ocellatus TaxID=259542 RepID=A0AAV4APX0_9GAST|nr:reverse transcriptase [Plakobranchus ocellatus]